MKKVLLSILGLGILAACGFGIFKKRRPAYTEAVWVSDVIINNGEEKEKTVNEMASDVDQAISDMDIEDELAETSDDRDDFEKTIEMARKAGIPEKEILKTQEDINEFFTGSRNIDQKADEILKEGTDVLKKANEMLGDSEENRRKEEEIRKKLEEIEQKEKKRKEEKLNADIQKAIERNDITEMYRLFSIKYAIGPVDVTPASAFGGARSDGLITDEIYKAAHKRYERLWNYAGD